MSRDISPEYTKNRVKQAGQNVRRGMATPEDLLVIENWRAAHNHVLNSWQAILRKRCKGRLKVVFAQRLKRRNTIFDKLSRENGMDLPRMQDIAGCRLIFETISDLEKFRNNLHNSKTLQHARKKKEALPYPYNYIETPAPSGYRGIHDIYEYKNRNSRSNNWNGLMVEIQYRTIYQHAWATAVEVAGSVTGNHSKFNKGEESHKEFFRLTSEIISRTHENKKSCKKDLSDEELLRQFDEIEKSTGLLERLSLLQALNTHQAFKKRATILVFGGDYHVRVYQFDSLPSATKKYFELENETPDLDIVLVRAETQNSIRDAFRNYFSDAQDFVRLVKNGTAKLEFNRL